MKEEKVKRKGSENGGKCCWRKERKKTRECKRKKGGKEENKEERKGRRERRENREAGGEKVVRICSWREWRKN